MPTRTSERQEMLPDWGFRCLELVLYGIRVVAEQFLDSKLDIEWGRLTQNKVTEQFLGSFRKNRILVSWCPSVVTAYLNSYLSPVLIDEIISNADLRSSILRYFDTKRKKDF